MIEKWSYSMLFLILSLATGIMDVELCSTAFQKDSRLGDHIQELKIQILLASTLDSLFHLPTCPKAMRFACLRMSVMAIDSFCLRTLERRKREV